MWRWIRELVPLGRGHRAALQLHLLALDAADRYQRFGMHLEDEPLLAWTARIDWAAEHWWGAWSADGGGLLGALQLAPTARPGVWELGLSVGAAVRQRGIGTAMLMAATSGAHLPTPSQLLCLHGHPAVHRMALRQGYAVLVADTGPALCISIAAA